MTVKRMLLAIVIIFGVIQFLPFGRLDARSGEGGRIEAHISVPVSIEQLLSKACADCHSSSTRVPWYGRVAPVSWLVAYDVQKARTAMDLSGFLPPGSSKARAAGLLMAACAGVQAGRMPPVGYTFMHPDAKLNPAEAQEFCKWSMASAKQLLRKVNN